MSYNYDINPWDDNYNSSSTNQQQQQQQQNTGYSTTDYSDPTAFDQYSTSNPQQYIYQDEQQQQQYDETGGQQQQQQQSNDQQNFDTTQQPPSAIRRFLRQHVPICNTFLDTLSSINLPFIDALVQHVNRDLLVSKIFYFFFYSAFGSLFPLMGVYFKQLGMNPAQVGILTGVRPFIEIFSAPFWHSLADRFHKSKALLLFSLLSWIIFTHSLAHIRPPASACIAFNDTDYVLYTPYSSNDLRNYEEVQDQETSTEASALLTTTSGAENELFLNKMPQKDKEVKVEILAKEETENDQRRRRRRRRRRRQVDEQQVVRVIDQEAAALNGAVNGKQRYFYSASENDKDDAYNSHLDLNVDLESDFDDKFLSSASDTGAGKGSWSIFADTDTDSGLDGGGDDEISQSYLKGGRYERSVVRDIDDVLGESDESEPTEEVDEPVFNGRQQQQQQKKQKQKSKGKMANSGRQVVEADEQAEEEEAETEEKAAATAAAGGSGDESGAGKKDHESGKPPTPAEPQPTTTDPSSVVVVEIQQQVVAVNKTKRVYKQRHKTPPNRIVGMSPITVEYAVNYQKEKHSQFVTPMFSTIVYKLDDIKEVFFLLLLLISLGEFFSAPALTLADSATLSYLGDNVDLYGRQRMFGSLSWAVTLLLVGMALDNATSIADHPCGPHNRERSYNVCFIIFSLLMACAFLTATQFRFSYPKGQVTSVGGNGAATTTVVAANSGNTTVVTTTLQDTTSGNIDELYASTQPRSIFNTAPPVNAPPSTSGASGGGQRSGGTKEKFEYLDKWKSAVFAQRTWELPEWVNVFRQFRNSLHLMYLFITWFLGCGVGLVFTFLFWHLQDVGGTPTLFGICSVINHISEILAYFFSFHVIKRFGHTRVLSVGLGCNVIRFLYVAFLTDPRYALPFELVQGITHAACFAACCSYISHVSKPELRTSTQGVMQGLHHGIGRACGALLGGYMINAIGSRASFCIYGLLSGCVLAGFLYVRKKASELEGLDDEEVKVDDSEALGGYGAPQGVPSAIPGKIGGVGVVGGGNVNIGFGSQPQQSVAATTQDIDYQW